MRNVLISLTKNLWYKEREKLNLILAVELRCHKVQGMMEAFTDTQYSHAKTSSSVHQKAVFTTFLEGDSR